MKSLCTAALLILLTLSVACAPKGANWQSMEKLSQEQQGVEVSVSCKERLKMGEQIQFKALSSKSGKIWVFEVDPEDRLKMIFPNSLSPANRITAGQEMTIPPPDSGWKVVAQPPPGESLVVFVVTAGGTPLAEVLKTPVVKHKAFSVIADDPKYGAAEVKLWVEQEAAN